MFIAPTLTGATEGVVVVVVDVFVIVVVIVVVVVVVVVVEVALVAVDPVPTTVTAAVPKSVSTVVIVDGAMVVVTHAPHMAGQIPRTRSRVVLSASVHSATT